MIDAHRGAFEYDWRARFGKSLKVIGTKRMTWGEALRLTQKLASDTTSQVGAAMSGWDYPVSREALVLMDDYDLKHHIAWAQGGGKGNKPQPYPRPWYVKATTTRRATPDESLTQDEIIAVLRKAGHTAALPT